MSGKFKAKLIALKLKTKIFLFSSIIIVTSLVSFTIIGGVFIKDVSIGKAKEDTARELTLIGNSMDLMINSIRDYVINISFDNRMINELDDFNNGKIDNYKLRSSLTKIVNENLGVTNLVSGCDIVTQKGDIISVSPYINESIKDIIIQFHQSNNLDNEAVKWYGPVKVMHNNGLYSDIMVLRKNIVGIYDPQYLGTIYMYVDETVFSDIYKSSVKENNNQYMLIDKSNTIISTSNSANINENIIELLDVDEFKFSELLENRNIEINYESESHYIAIEQLSAIDWFIISDIPTSNFVKTYRRYLLLLLVIGFVELIVSVTVSVYMSRSVTKPLTEFVNVMEEIEEGNRELRVDLTSSKELEVLQSTFNKLMDSNNNLVDAVYENQQNIRNHEMLLLQAQIKPHFLYNALGTIASFIKLDMKNEALDSVHSLAKYFRISLSEGEEIITIEEEIELVKNYLIIQRYRYINMLNFEINIDKNMYKYLIPKITIQPIVENAIYHGIKPKENETKSQITIDGYIKDGLLIIEITDDGVGINDEDLLDIMKKINNKYSGTHFGIRSVHQRIKLLHGEKYGINIVSKKNEYTKVSIRLPMK